MADDNPDLPGVSIAEQLAKIIYEDEHPDDPWSDWKPDGFREQLIADAAQVLAIHAACVEHRESGESSVLTTKTQLNQSQSKATGDAIELAAKKLGEDFFALDGTPTRAVSADNLLALSFRLQMGAGEEAGKGGE